MEPEELEKMVLEEMAKDIPSGRKSLSDYLSYEMKSLIKVIAHKLVDRRKLEELIHRGY